MKLLIFFGFSVVFANPTYASQKKKMRLYLPEKMLEISYANSNGDFQPSQVLEFGLSFRKKAQKQHYITYVSMYAQHIHSVFEGELSTFATSALGIRLGAGLPIFFNKWPLVIFTGLGYAFTSTQKDPWFGQPEISENSDALVSMSLGAKFIYKKYSFFFRQDLNSFKSYIRPQFIGIGYLF